MVTNYGGLGVENMATPEREVIVMVGNGSLFMLKLGKSPPLSCLGFKTTIVVFG